MPTRTYAGRTAAERAAERRERLVAASVTVLARDGESAATMTAICAEARLTERYFYESFRNRDAALVVALDTVATRIVDCTEAALLGSDGSPGDRVAAITTAFVDLVLAEPAVGVVAVRESQGNALLRARRHALVGAFADRFAEEATALFGDRAWPTARGRIQGVVFIAGLAEAVGSWLEGESALSPAELGEVARDLFLALSVRPG